MKPLSHRFRAAFTLVELIVVMAVIVVLISLSAPAISSMQRAKDVTTVAYELADAIEQARTYAIANNTYVFFGITEVDGTKSVTTTPQIYSKTAGGRIACAVIASKDGTFGCSNINDIPTSWASDYKNYKGTNFAIVRKLQIFDNVHIGVIGTGSPPTPPLTGRMVRPSVNSDRMFGNWEGSAGTAFRKASNTFAWPLGTAYGAGQFNFERVLTFDPQGVPYVFYKQEPSIAGWFELGLQQTKGNALPTPPPDQNRGNHAAIVISGTVGTNRIFRP